MKSIIRAGWLCALAFLLATLSGCGASKQNYLDKGNKFFAAGKYDEASLNYRAAIQKDATFGEAYYRLGLTAVKFDQVREAYNALFRARSIAARKQRSPKRSSPTSASASTWRTPGIRSACTPRSANYPTRCSHRIAIPTKA